METTQRAVYQNLTYNDDIKTQIINSGGTVIFTRENIILASEISEKQYRELLNNPYIDKIDVLPLKRYANEGVKYQKSVINTNIKKLTN